MFYDFFAREMKKVYDLNKNALKKGSFFLPIMWQNLLKLIPFQKKHMNPNQTCEKYPLFSLIAAKIFLQKSAFFARKKIVQNFWTLIANQKKF